MNTIDHKSERGQAIVYLAIGLVVFLGFVAMAIDGGMVLSDRRHLQNAADAGSLAGGGMAALSLEENGVTNDNWDCSSGSLISALNIAETTANSRSTGNITLEDSSVTVDATCNQANQYIEVTVNIMGTTPSNFLQVVFPDALQNAVDAVTRIYPRGPLAYGNAIVALNTQTQPCNMVTGAGFSGTADITVTGGGIFTNGCLVGGGNAFVNVTDGNISYNAGDNDYDNFTPEPINVSPDQIPPSAYAVTEPDVNLLGQCTDPGANNITADELMELNKDPLTLDPGLWCITGNKNLTINSSEVDPFHALGVTFYIVEDIAVTINGSAQLTLTAPVEDPTDPSYAPPPAILGLLIYMPPSNHSSLTINGGSDFTVTGTILAPGSRVKIDGGSDTIALGSQIIGFDVALNGNATIDITYLGGLTAKLPTSMDLHR